MTAMEASLRWRHAVKKYDMSGRLTVDELAVLKQALRLAPSSFGLRSVWTDDGAAMNPVSPGRVLVTLVAFWSAFGSYVFDWNETHIFNAAWPPHAKFHNAQTMLLGTAIGLLSLWTLWFSRVESVKRLRFASVLASLYWLTQMGALLFPGTALIDPNFAHPGQAPAQLIVDAVMLTLLSAGYALESRRLGR